MHFTQSAAVQRANAARDQLRQARHDIANSLLVLTLSDARAPSAEAERSLALLQRGCAVLAATAQLQVGGNVAPAKVEAQAERLRSALTAWRDARSPREREALEIRDAARALDTMAAGIFLSIMTELRELDRVHELASVSAMTLAAVLLGVLALIFRASSRATAQALLQLERSEANFRATFDQAAVGIAHVDLRTGAWLRVNRKFLELTGYAESTLNKHTIIDLTHPDDMPGQQALIRRLLKGEIDSCALDKRYVRADGSHLWVHLTVSLMHDETGERLSAIGIIQDISARRQAERDLRESQAILQSFYDSTSYGMGVVELDGEEVVFLHVNATIGRLYGRSPESIDRCRASELVPAAVIALWHKHYREAERTRVPVRFEYLRDFDRRNQTIEATVAYLGAGDGGLPRFSFVTEDVTESRQLAEQLRQAHKMEAVGRLAAGVAHDFNNLLSVVLGFSDLLRARLHDDDPAQAYVTDIRSAAERAVALTRQLLAFSRRQVLAPERLDLNARIVGIMTMLGRLLGENIEIVTRLGEQLPAVEVDPTQLEQVVVNLAVNARDAMPQGGTLELATSAIVLDASFCEHRAECRPGDYVMLAVSDTGSGIAVAAREHLFEPFFTTKDVGKGTGLGLATVFGIVKQSGGYINVESQMGAGTLFRVYLPVAGSAESATASDLVPQGP